MRHEEVECAINAPPVPEREDVRKVVRAQVDAVVDAVGGCAWRWYCQSRGDRAGGWSGVEREREPSSCAPAARGLRCEFVRTSHSGQMKGGARDVRAALGRVMCGVVVVAQCVARAAEFGVDGRRGRRRDHARTRIARHRGLRRVF